MEHDITIVQVFVMSSKDNYCAICSAALNTWQLSPSFITLIQTEKLSYKVRGVLAALSNIGEV